MILLFVGWLIYTLMIIRSIWVLNKRVELLESHVTRLSDISSDTVNILDKLVLRGKYSDESTAPSGIAQVLKGVSRTYETKPPGQQLWNMEKKKHECEFNPVKVGHYSTAADECFEDDAGFLWVGNMEYANTVNFCPFCGYKAKVTGAVKVENEREDEKK